MPSIRANDLPPYARRAGDPCFPPPYTVDKAGMDIFICNGDEAALNTMIESALNQPTALKYGTPDRLRFELADRRVGFACIDVTRLRSQFGDNQRSTTLAQRVGVTEIYARQTEVAVMVQVRDNHGLPYWYLPYVLNSLPTAITTGREIYGYPKQQAYFAPHPESPQNAGGPRMLFGLDKEWDKLSIQAYDVGPPDDQGRAEFLRKDVLQFRKGSPGAQVEANDPWVPEVGPSDFEFYPDYWPLDPAPDRGRNDPAGELEVQGLVLPAAETNAAEEFLLRIRSDVPYVFLRQFRDPQEPKLASYQSLVLGRLIPDSADQLKVMEDHDYTVVMPWAFNLAMAEHVFGKEQQIKQANKEPAAIERAVVGLLSGRDATFKVLDATVLWEFGQTVSDDRRLEMLESWLTEYAKAIAR
jgi:hypothetical protein